MTRKAKAAPAQIDDPVVRIGMELAALWRRFNSLDKTNSSEEDHQHKIYREDEMRNVEDRIHVFRTMLSTTQCSSLAGALVQLAEIMVLAEAAGIENELDDGDARAITRMCFSAIAAIATAVPASVVGALDVNYEHLNPWVPFENRLALTGGRRKTRGSAEAAAN